MSKLSERLNELVEESKKTLTEIEKSTGVLHSNLSEFLSDKHTPSYENFVALLYLFNCSADYLLGKDELHTDEPLHEVLPFGPRLRAVMKEQGISQGYMIKTMPLSSSALYKWLSGQSMPSTDSLLRIADFLDCSVDYLIGRRR